MKNNNLSIYDKNICENVKQNHPVVSFGENNALFAVNVFGKCLQDFCLATLCCMLLPAICTEVHRILESL